MIMKHINPHSLSRLLAVLTAGAVLATLGFAADQSSDMSKDQMNMSGSNMAKSQMNMSGDNTGMGQHGMKMAMPENGTPLTVTGEVLDMACYLDHGAHGAGHAACARKCISSGLPVGIKSADGTTYLLIGDHMPANSELAKYAAKTITVRGKYVTRDGIKLLENIEILN
jgi:hypothetical protein